MTERELRLQYNDIKPGLHRIKERIVQSIELSLENVSFVDHVYGRVKGNDSLAAKATDTKKYPNPFVDIEDIIGIRVLVLFRSTSKLVAETIYHRISKPIENEYRTVRDPDTDKPDPRAFAYESYQSIHRVTEDFTSDLDPKSYPKVFELQIRTLFQHAWEEPDHLLSYKNQLLERLVAQELYHYERRFSGIAASAWLCDGILEQLLTEYENLEAR